MRRPLPPKEKRTVLPKRERPVVGRSARLAATAVAIAALMALPIALPAAAAAPEPVYVPASDIGTDSSDATPHWVSDNRGTGSFATTTDSFDGIRPVLKLTTPESSDQVRVLKRYGTTSPPKIPTLLNGASYTYTGSNPNFQIEIFFTPNNLDQYGPKGTEACTPANAGAGNIPDLCYTTLKWQPRVPPQIIPSGTWKTVDLTADTAFTSEVGGWLNTNRVGSYPSNEISKTRSEYLAQIASYVVIGVGTSMGAGQENSTSWIKNLTFGGTEYRFGSAPPAQEVVLDDAARTVEVTDSDQPLVIEVASGTEDAGVDYSDLLTGGEGDIPQTTITSDGVTVEIPETRVTSDNSDWNGIIKAPTVVSNDSVTIPAESGTTVTIATAIEVGAGDTGLTFDKGVRLLLPGQADKNVGFERDGTFTPITAQCSADSQAAGNALTAGDDCYISVENDMVIWTKHFTTFVAYSSAAALAATGAAAALPLTLGAMLLLGVGVGVVLLAHRRRVLLAHRR